MPPSRGNNKDTAPAPKVRGGRPSREAPEDRQPFLPEILQRALALGLSGIFTTEAAFRRALGDTLPKDWVDFAVDQSDRTRTEFVNRLAEEMVRVLETADLEGITRRLMADQKIELKVEVRMVPDESAKQKGAGERESQGSRVAGARGKPR